MDYKFETFKMIIGGLGAGLIRLLGINYKLVILLMILMIGDTILGHLTACKLKTWTSKQAKWGAIGKLVELFIIALMYIAEWTFGVGYLVNTVVIYFMLCEAASIAENIIHGELNKNVPREIVDLLRQIRDNCARALTDKIKALFDDGSDND